MYMCFDLCICVLMMKIRFVVYVLVRYEELVFIYGKIVFCKYFLKLVEGKERYWDIGD